MKIGKWNVSTDELNWILSDIQVKGEDAKNPGEEYTCNHTYYGSLSALLVSLSDKLHREAFTEADTVDDIVSKIVAKQLNFINNLEELISENM